MENPAIIRHGIFVKLKCLFVCFGKGKFMHTMSRLTLTHNSCYMKMNEGLSQSPAETSIVAEVEVVAVIKY